MPELPEVEVVRQGLAASVVGAKVLSVEVFDERALTRHRGTPLDFVSRIEGRTLLAASRRGKFLWLPLAPTAPAAPAEVAVVAEPVEVSVASTSSTTAPAEPVEVSAPTEVAEPVEVSAPTVVAEPVEVSVASTGSTTEKASTSSADVGASTGSATEGVSTGSADVGASTGSADGRGSVGVAGGSPQEALLAHLGMSGQLLVRTIDAPEDKHLRIRMRVEGPAGEYELRFVDQRLFGSLAIDQLVGAADLATERIPSQVAHIARDPIDPQFDRTRFTLRIRSTKRGIKAALLDQEIVSGVGNIYADEALWRARLHWAQPASTLSVRKINELLEQVQDVFAQSLEEGGTSFDSLYVNVNGQSGYFSRSLNAYGRAGLPCVRCGAVMVREAFANRSSFRCPRCQRRR